ncbi:MAG TPA: hypothetical protein VFN37_03610 [Candidatus Baltobacteraceae bacterium]|nr:hypothetical protein [Candidatus Baltobacteraceae bacterium]
MWFTEWSGNAIGRIAGTGGSVMEYTSGMPGNTEPTNIISGPSNNLLFTWRISER